MYFVGLEPFKFCFRTGTTTCYWTGGYLFSSFIIPRFRKSRVQNPKGRKAGIIHNNIAPADMKFPAANSKIPKPPSKTLKEKAQQHQRFFTVSLRVFFFLRCEFCSSVRIEHFCCYICFVAGGFFKQEKAQEQEESLHHHHEVCNVVPVFWFFVFFFLFFFLLWFGLLVLTL